MVAFSQNVRASSSAVTWHCQSGKAGGEVIDDPRTHRMLLGGALVGE
jgi:hypothetical protein